MVSGRRPPPGWARRLLRSALPIGAVGESIRGDLEAEYEERSGPAWLADAWYIVESLKIAWHYRSGLGVSGTAQDIRYGVRVLWRMPWITTVAVLSLAAGIAASTVMFATMYGFLYAPLPYAQQDDLYTLLQTDRATGSESWVSAIDVLELSERVPALPDVAAWRSYGTTLTSATEPVPIRRMDATPNVFDVLGREAALGRTFAVGEGLPGPRVGVLTHAAWVGQFGADPGLIGRSIEVAGRNVTVIGVMPEEFQLLPANVGLVVANTFALERRSGARAPVQSVMALPEGVTPDQLRAQLEGAWQRLAEVHPDALGRYGIRLETLREQYPGASDARLVEVMLLVALFVLVIAATNVATVLLAKADERGPELAVRLALGAGRVRLVRQILTEATLLSAAGGVLGVAMAWLAVEQLGAIWPAEMPDAFRPRAHPTVLGFTLFISLGVGILFGLAPALHTLHRGPGSGLSKVTRGGPRPSGLRGLRTALVTGQIAIALALLSGAGAMTQLSRNLVDVELGVRSEGLLTFRTTASGALFDDPRTLARFHDDIEAALLSIPGAEAVAVMDELPRGRSVPTPAFTIEGRAAGADEPSPVTMLLSVNHGYFETMEIPIREGRRFLATDRMDASPVAVVSEAFADFHFPGGSALGRRIELFGVDREIVGVAANVFHSRVELAGGLRGLAYLPMEQGPVRDVAYAIRTSGDPLAIAEEVRGAVRSVHARAPVSDVQTLDAFIELQMSDLRVIGRTMTLFGLLALLLSAMGTYGVMAHSVSGRRREIGIRVALGSGARGVIRLVLGQAMGQAALGIAMGLPIALLIRRATVGLGAEFRADIGGPSTVVWVTLALASVCLFASYLPARRATRIDPIQTLRADG